MSSVFYLHFGWQTYSNSFCVVSTESDTMSNLQAHQQGQKPNVCAGVHHS
jgi:hypothetical protein